MACGMESINDQATGFHAGGLEYGGVMADDGK
jgi:hypothetical protein